MSRLYAVLLVAFTTPLTAQSDGLAPGRSGPRVLLPLDREIALARSAAPPAVSDSATVYTFTRDGYALAVRGSNGVTCYVGRSWPASLEPHCHDAEGSVTVLPMAMRRVELLHRGLSSEAVEREIAAGLASGRFRVPRRPALSWMMSGAQRLSADDGREVGRWRAHLMIYYPYLTAAELGLVGALDLRHAVLADAGKPNASLVIVVSEFIEPRGAGFP